MTKVTQINFSDPEASKHKVHFDNLTPLYPNDRLKMEIEDPTIKDKTARLIDLVSPIGKGQRSLIVRKSVVLGKRVDLGGRLILKHRINLDVQRTEGGNGCNMTTEGE